MTVLVHESNSQNIKYGVPEVVIVIVIVTDLAKEAKRRER